MSVTKLTPAIRKEVESRSPKVMPDRPSDKGWTGEQVRKHLYEATMMVYDLLAEHVDEVANILDNSETGIEVKVATLLGYFAEGIAKKAKADQNGNIIDTTYFKIGANNTVTGSNTFNSQNEFSGRAIFSGNLNLYNIPMTTNSKNYFVRVGVTTGQYVNYKLPYNYSDVGAQDYVLSTTSYVQEKIAENNASMHRLQNDSAGYICQVYQESDDPVTSDNRLANHQDALNMTYELSQIREAIAMMLGIRTDELEAIKKIINGHISVGMANHADRAGYDSEGRPIVVDDYGKSVTMAYDSTNGKLTINLFNQSGTKISNYTIDLPCELVFTNQYYDNVNKKLVFVPASGGSNIEISLSDLVDTYTEGTDSDDICQVSINNHQISVSIKDGSISMAKLSSTLQQTWNGWVSAEADRVLAEQGRVAAENQRVLNENARLALPHLDIDGEGYLIINYGSSRDITID